MFLLAAVIAWLIVFSNDGDEGSGTDDDKHDKPPVTNGAELVALEKRLGERFKRIDTELEKDRERTETVQKAVADIQKALVGIEPRVAQAICDRLKPELCTRGINRAPSALLVESNFTLLFENARLDENGVVSEQSVGIRLTPAQQRRLDAIARAFRPCNDGGQVRFSIHGSSSTAEFQARQAEREEPLPETDDYNLATARLRAQVVADYLSEREFTAKPVEISPDLDAMARPYVDDAVSGETDQEGLNRSVFIEVVSAGACGQSAQ